MKSLNIVFCFVMFNCISSAQIFEKFFYANGYTTNDVSFTSDNGYIVVAHETMEPFKPIISKLDAAFNTDWSKQLDFQFPPSSASDASYTVQESNQGGYLFFADIESDSWVIKFDSIGNEVWNVHQTFNDYLYNKASQIRELPDGNIILFKSYSSRLFFARLSPTGNVNWSKTLSEDTTQGKNPGLDFECMPDGSIIVTGESETNNCFARIDVSGNMTWNKIHDILDIFNQPLAIANMDDGNLLVGGRRTSAYYMKVDATNGDVLWQKEINENFTVEEITALGNNKYAIAGYNDSGFEESFVVDEFGTYIEGEQFSSVFLPDYYPPRFKKYGTKIYLTFRAIFGVTTKGIVIIESQESLIHECIANSIAINQIPPSTVTYPLGSLQMFSSGVYTTDSIPYVNYIDFMQVSDMCDLIDIENHEQNNLNEIILYPNPISGNNSLKIEINKTGLKKVYVTDLTGKIILSNSFNKNRFEISMTDLSKGMYLVNVINDSGEIFSKKIIKE